MPSFGYLCLEQISEVTSELKQNLFLALSFRPTSGPETAAQHELPNVCTSWAKAMPDFNTGIQVLSPKYEEYFRQR